MGWSDGFEPNRTVEGEARKSVWTDHVVFQDQPEREGGMNMKKAEEGGEGGTWAEQKKEGLKLAPTTQEKDYPRSERLLVDGTDLK
jgi:hypothetical protein